MSAHLLCESSTGGVVLLPPLATVEDYAASYRYAAATEPRRLPGRLARASALVREVTGQLLTLVEGDRAELVSTGSDWLSLPEYRVRRVRRVLLDSHELLGWTWLAPHGLLLPEPIEAGTTLTVVYDHGYDPIPADLVEVVVELAHTRIGSAEQLTAAERRVLDRYTHCVTGCCRDQRVVRLPRQRRGLRPA